MNFKNDCFVIVGAVIGGLLGMVAFKWLVGQGFYALLLPGGLLGMGAGIFRSPSKIVASVCGFLALAFGLVAEWSEFPFLADASFGYFLRNVYELKPVTLIMIGLGGAIGFWIPFRRSQDAQVTSNRKANVE